MPHYLYILYSTALDSYYVGQSMDPWNRVKEHNQKQPPHFTGKASDWVLEAIFTVAGPRQNAIRLERFIKRQKSRRLILKILDRNWIPTGILVDLKRID